MFTKEDIAKFVHIYQPYEQDMGSLRGTDFAIIQIPPYESYMPMSVFQVWVTHGNPSKQSCIIFEDPSTAPDGFSVTSHQAKMSNH